jgi:hypothetical protein
MRKDGLSSTVESMPTNLPSLSMPIEQDGLILTCPEALLCNKPQFHNPFHSQFHSHLPNQLFNQLHNQLFLLHPSPNLWLHPVSHSREEREGEQQRNLPSNKQFKLSLPTSWLLPSVTQLSTTTVVVLRQLCLLLAPLLLALLPPLDPSLALEGLVAETTLAVAVEG